MNVQGVSHVLPSRVVTNDDVLERLADSRECRLSDADRETFVGWTRAAFDVAGTHTRYHLGDDERPYELCVRAGEAALRDAGMGPHEVDLVIYAGIARGFLEPATATVFQDLLGLRNATCFDVLDACASWIRAVDVAQKFLQLGRYRVVLVLTAEFIGRRAYRYDVESLDEFEHWFPGVTVGEAATAAVLTLGDQPEAYASDFRTWGDKRGLCLIPLDNCIDYLGMDVAKSAMKPLRFASFGADLLRFGSSKLVSHFRESNSFSAENYDIIFGHPASDGICEAIGRRCRLDFSKFKFTHHLFGNTASASLPLAISVAKQEGRFRPGGRVLMMFASAGVSTALLRYVQTS